MAENRKVKVVDRQLQFQIIGIVVSTGAIISLISTFGLRMITTEIMTLLDENAVSDTVTIKVMMQLNQMSMYIVIFAVLSLVIAWTGAIYLSNRVAGPIHSINRSLDAFLDGNEDVRITLRKHDFFSDLATRINKMIEATKKHV